MKFNVTKNGLGTYDVRLHWESKERIRKITSYALFGATVGVVTWRYVK